MTGLGDRSFNFKSNASLSLRSSMWYKLYIQSAFDSTKIYLDGDFIADIKVWVLLEVLTLVGVTRFELAALASQMRCATNCATPRIIKYEICLIFCKWSNLWSNRFLRKILKLKKYGIHRIFKAFWRLCIRFALEELARSQSRRATNCATPRNVQH